MRPPGERWPEPGRRRRRILRSAAALLAAGALGLAATACRGTGDEAGGADDGATTLTVFAAASLRTAFDRLGEDFETQSSGVDVAISYGGSSDLVTQVTAGAPADVLATADEPTMADTADTLAGDPEIFATNTLTIVTAPGNPHDIAGLADLADPELAVVVCAPHVPCGRATASATDSAGVELSPVSEENSVTGVLGAVRSGQADAGVVYTTDAAAAGDDVTAVPFPEAATAVNRYPIGVLARSEQRALADEFAAFVLSERGRQVLADAGFGVP